MWGSKILVYDFFKKVIKLDFICRKWSWWKIKKYLQQKISRKVLVPATADFTSRASKSYIPFTCLGIRCTNGQFYMSGKILKTIYFLKGNNGIKFNTLWARKTKRNNYWGINCHFSLYNLYKIHKSFYPLILSPKSHISVLSASRPFRKCIVYSTLPGIEFTILYKRD